MQGLIAVGSVVKLLSGSCVVTVQPARALKATTAIAARIFTCHLEALRDGQ